MENKLNEILQQLGVSKVKLAKYLGVSRQMIYNYMELNNLNKWPKEKKVLMLKLLEIDDGSDKSLSKIKITPEYIQNIENKLSMEDVNISFCDDRESLDKLNKPEQQLYSDITYLVRDKLSDSYKHDENVAVLTYIYHLLQTVDNVEEVAFMLAYLSKMVGLSDPNEFKFDEDKQFIFEGIVYSAINLYVHGGASKSRVTDSRAKFVQEIEQKKEEILERTQQLFTIKKQALKELGYAEYTNENSDEVLEKIAEIESRKW